MPAADIDERLDAGEIVAVQYQCRAPGRDFRHPLIEERRFGGIGLDALPQGIA